MNKVDILFDLLEECNEFNKSIYDETLLESLNKISDDSSKVILSGKLLMIYGYYEEYFRKVNKAYWKCINKKKSKIDFNKISNEIVSNYKPLFKTGENERLSYKLYYDALSSLHNQSISKVSPDIFLERLGILKFSHITLYSNMWRLKEYRYLNGIKINLPEIEAIGVKEYKYSGSGVYVENSENVYKSKHDQFIEIRNSIAHTGKISGIDFIEMYTDILYSVFAIFQIYTKRLICDVLERTRGKELYDDYEISGKYILCHSPVKKNHKYIFYKTDSTYYVDKIKTVMKDGQFLTDVTNQRKFGIELDHKLRMNTRTKIYFV